MSRLRAKRTDVYRGRLINLGLETIDLPGDLELELEIVRHPGGAVIVAVNADKDVCLIRQYRYAVGGNIWELPAGTIDREETPLQTAKRELEEEAGVRAKQWRDLGTIWPSPGYCDEILYLYLAQELEITTAKHNSDELIEVHWLPLETALVMAHENEIRDAKTVAGLFYTNRLLAP
jgi:ADP-ribose pyrophosphatase